MKKILFVINTLGNAGAEVALTTMLAHIPEEYELYLYVLTGQGEMIHRVPERVHVMNTTYNDHSVLSKEGKKELYKGIIKRCFSHGAIFKNFFFLISQGVRIPFVKGRGLDKLLWRVLSDGAERFEEEFDLAVAYLEGGSTYYVMDHVKAKKKATFLHIDYLRAGYSRGLDKNCYTKYDQIFTVSDEVKGQFLKVYPECAERTDIFHNLIPQTEIRKKAENASGFTDDYQGKRILTVGRLTAQKAYEVSVDAMKLVKEQGIKARWYVLGEGEERKKLEEQIAALGLTEDFILMGAVANPYPFYKETDLYVHASRFEGKSIAIQEAQTLGCAILVSDCSGNREQVVHGLDGRMCKLDSAKLAEEIVYMLSHEEECEKYREEVRKKDFEGRDRIAKLLDLCES